MYITKPMEIESKSMDIIDQQLGEHKFNAEELIVVKRTIHTTGDFDYKNIVKFRNNPIRIGLEVLSSQCRIVTDTRMAFSGINKRALNRLNCTIDCYIDHENTYTMAKEKEITRSMAAVDLAAESPIDIFVVGNAPTALFRLGELIHEGIVKPKLIVGVPVGYVGAAESKEYIREFDVPTITTEGTKGGSNVAAAIVNALLYMKVER